jgi:hypothetical protein
MLLPSSHHLVCLTLLFKTGPERGCAVLVLVLVLVHDSTLFASPCLVHVADECTAGAQPGPRRRAHANSLTNEASKYARQHRMTGLQHMTRHYAMSTGKKYKIAKRLSLCICTNHVFFIFWTLHILNSRNTNRDPQFLNTRWTLRAHPLPSLENETILSTINDSSPLWQAYRTWKCRLENGRATKGWVGERLESSGVSKLVELEFHTRLFEKNRFQPV